MICTTVKNGDGYKVFMIVNGGHYVTNPRGEQIVYPMIHQALNKIAEMNAIWVTHDAEYKGCDLYSDKSGRVYVVSDDNQVFCDYTFNKIADAKEVIDHHMSKING